MNPKHCNCVVIKKDGSVMTFQVDFDEGNAEATRFAVFTTAHVPAEGQGIAIAVGTPSLHALDQAMEFLDEQRRKEFARVIAEGA